MHAWVHTEFFNYYDNCASVLTQHCIQYDYYNDSIIIEGGN